MLKLATSPGQRPGPRPQEATGVQRVAKLRNLVPSGRHAAVGDKLGDKLGDALGDVLGVALGVPLGIALGVPFGVPLGVELGDTLGTALGDVLGHASTEQHTHSRR